MGQVSCDCSEGRKAALEGDPGERAAGGTAGVPVTGIILSARIHISMYMCVFALPSQLIRDSCHVCKSRLGKTMIAP